MGDFFPSCRLVVLKGKQDRAYLGLPPEARVFSLEDLKAQYLLIELYNELCIGCLREVSAYNKLFDLIENHPGLRGKLKMMGLGVGSKKRHVAKFRRDKKVAFPLFADEKQNIFECLGSPDLPVSYLLQKKSGSGYRIIRKHSGHVGSPARLLDMIERTIKGQKDN